MNFSPVLYTIGGIALLAIGFACGFWFARFIIMRRLQKSLQKAWKLGYVEAMGHIASSLIDGDPIQTPQMDPMIAKPMPPADSVIS